MTAVDIDDRGPVVEGRDHAERTAGPARRDRDRRGAQAAPGAPLTDTDRRLISEAAFVIGDAIALLRMTGHRIPRRWPRLLDALNRALSAGGHREPVDLSALKTTKQLAAEWGCDARTVRRKAETAGGRKVHGWIFPEGT